MSLSEDEQDWILDQILPDYFNHRRKSARVDVPRLLRLLQPPKPLTHQAPAPLSPGTSPLPPGTGSPDRPSLGSLDKAESSGSDIEIPEVFRVQGEKNRRLLRQNDEIQRQLEAETCKELARVNQVLALQRDFLLELNDNGVGYEYSMGHDRPYVQDLVDMHLRQDPELTTRRHFYYFSPPKRPDLRADAEMLEYLAEGGFENGTVAESGVAETGFAKNGIAEAGVAENGDAKTGEADCGKVCAVDMVDAALASSHLPHLAKVHAALLKNHPRDQLLHMPLSQYMEALGGCDPARCRLKLAHFNDSLPQLVFKAAVVMLAELSRCSSPREYGEVARHLYLASSDFLLNKHQRERLCAVLVGPVLERYVLGMGSQCSTLDMAQQFHTMVQAVELVTWGPEAVPCARFKEAEMYHNFLQNAMRSSLGAAAREFVEAVSCLFMGIGGPRMTLQGLVTQIDQICTPDLAAPDTIHKGVFQMQLAAAYVQRLVYGGVGHDDGGVLECRAALLESKDNLQGVVGNFSYVQSDQKVQISRSLSKAYHILDSITRVLDKMALFLGTDHFYNVPGQGLREPRGKVMQGMHGE